MKNPPYITSLDRLDGLPQEEQDALEEVARKFAFRTNEYYASLIDWDDPDDPLRKIIVPDTRELEDGGALDASGEKNYTRVPGLQHKYPQTALLLAVDVCGGFCRFCFRKRLFMNRTEEISRDFTKGIEYIRSHPEITNVLITGGDPLIMATRKLESLIEQLCEIENVRIIRIGSKMVSFNPYRIINDPSLADMIRTYSTGEKKIYIMAHFNHPKELTPVAVDGLKILMEAGAVIVNQTPLLKGINDDPAVLTELFRRLSFIGIQPYYVFQCRPTLGNRLFEMPVEAAYEIFEKAKAGCSGLAKRARFVMSHATGKIEMVGKTRDAVYLKYHQAADPADTGRFMVFRSNPDAYWFDDYDDLLDDCRITGDEDEDLPAFPFRGRTTDDTSAVG
jgi:lysine 2,3-aminomutase